MASEVEHGSSSQVSENETVHEPSQDSGDSDLAGRRLPLSRDNILKPAYPLAAEEPV